MQRPTLTARRFYTAFYRWHILTSTSSANHAHTHCLASQQLQRRAQWHTLRHLTSTSPQQRQSHTLRGGRGNSDPTLHTRQLDVSNRFNPSKVSSHSWKDWLRATEVQRAADKPFDTLDVWEDVVRYRSGMRVMVETCLPSERVRELGMEYGEGLGGMGEKLFGVGSGGSGAGGPRVEVGENAIEREGLRGAAQSVVSVLYSGTFDEVEKIRMNLGSVKTTSVDTSEDDGSQDLHARGGRGSGMVRKFLAYGDESPSERREREYREGRRSGNTVRRIESPTSPAIQPIEKRHTLAQEMDYDTTIRQSQASLFPTTTTTTLSDPPNPKPNPNPKSEPLSWLLSSPTPHSALSTSNIHTPFLFILRSRTSTKPANAHVHISVLVPSAAWSTSLWHERVSEPNRLRIGADIHVGDEFYRDGLRMRGVEVKGRVGQVQRVRYAISKVKDRVGRLEGRRGLGGEAEKTSAASSKEMNRGLANMQLTSVGDGYTPLPSWLLTPPKSRTELTSSDLLPLQPVLRDRSQNGEVLSVEIIIPANEKWDREVMDLMQQPRESSLSLDLEAPFSKVDENTGDSHWRRPLMLKGSAKEILGVLELVESMRRKMLELAANGSVNDAVTPSGFANLPSEIGSSNRHQLQNPKNEATAPIHDRVKSSDRTPARTPSNSASTGSETYYCYSRMAVPSSIATGITHFLPIIEGDVGFGNCRIILERDHVRKGEERFLKVYAKTDRVLKTAKRQMGRAARRVAKKEGAEGSRVRVVEGPREGSFVVEEGGEDVSGVAVKGGGVEEEQVVARGATSPASAAEPSTPSHTPKYSHNLKFYARLAVPDAVVRTAAPRLAGFIKAKDLRGSQFHVEEKVDATRRAPCSREGDEVDSRAQAAENETVLLVRAQDPSSLHAFTYKAGKYASSEVASSKSLDVSAMECAKAGRILEMGTVNPDGVNVPDAAAAWHGRMYRGALDRFSFSNRIAIPASVAGSVTRLIEKNVRAVGLENCEIRTEEDPVVKGGERFLRVWAKSGGLLGEARRVVTRIVRRMAWKMRVEGWARVVDEDGMDVDKPTIGAGLLGAGGAEDVVQMFDEAVRTSTTNIDEVAEAEEVGQELASKDTDMSGDEPPVDYKAVPAPTTPPITTMYTADTAQEMTGADEWGKSDMTLPDSGDATASRTESSLPICLQVTIPTRHADYVIPKIPLITEKAARGSTETECAITMEPSSHKPNQTLFNIHVRSPEALTVARRGLRSIDAYARESVVNDGSIAHKLGRRIQLRQISGGEVEFWVLEDIYKTASELEIRSSSILPIYSRFAIPDSASGGLLKRGSSIREATGCIPEKSGNPAQSNDSGLLEQHFVLWSSSGTALRSGQDFVRTIVRAALTSPRDETSFSEVDANPAIRFLEQGMDADGFARSNYEYIRSLPRGREPDFCNFHAYSTFTLPKATLEAVNASVVEMIRNTKCQLNTLVPREVSAESHSENSDYRLYTLWGATAELVERARNMIEATVRKSLETQSADGAALTIVQEGVSDVTLGKVMEAEARTGTRRIEPSAMDHVTDEPAPSTVFNAYSNASDMEAYFEGAEGFESTGEDDMIFPEFTSPFADDMPLQRAPERRSFSLSLPSVAAGVRAPKKPLQQRAYSTFFRRVGTPTGLKTTGQKPTEHSDGALNGDQEVQAFSRSTGKEQLIDDIKRTLRTFTHPVVVITSRIPSFKDSDRLSVCRGVTVSSFNTVTLSPTPIISLNLRVPSRSWDAICESQNFSVHIVSATPEGAVIAHAFTQPYEQPSEPFQRLESLGVHTYVRMQSSGVLQTQPPRLFSNQIMARIDARLLPEKCVHVGDHVVVIAEARKVHFPTLQGSSESAVDEQVALAYAKKGFRSVGDGITPIDLPEVEIQEQYQNEHSISTTTTGTQTSEYAPTHITNDDPFGGEADRDQATAYSTAVVQPDENVNAQPKEHDDGDPRSGSVEGYFEQMESEAIKEDTVQRLPKAANRQTYNYTKPPEVSRAGPKRGSQSPWGISRNSKSSYSTSAARGTSWHTSFRPYSTSLSNPPPDARSTSKSSPIELVSDPELLSSTVANFLGIPEDENEHAPVYRIRGLIRLQKEAKDASRRLERALANGSLTTEESTRLENIVTRNERRVAKVLALRSAKDLRRVLDKGRVDYSQVQWLETNIEKGQAVLLEEAKQLRRMLDEKAINEEQFRLVRAKLEQQNQTLTAETTRLRQMVDEDSEGGGAVGRDFDGFKGNV